MSRRAPGWRPTSRGKLAELTVDRVELLPPSCQHCLFWELGAARRDDSHPSDHLDDELAGDPLVQKCAWWRATEIETGPPGRVLLVDGVAAGFCAFAPVQAYARRRAPVPRASDDALFLATLWVEPEYRGQGHGRLLLHAAIKDALRLDRRAVEAYGDRRVREGECVLPCTWLLHEGFQVLREHPRYPLLRLDVRSLARWGQPLESALEHARTRLARPSPAPVPVDPSLWTTVWTEPRPVDRGEPHLEEPGSQVEGRGFRRRRSG